MALHRTLHDHVRMRVPGRVVEDRATEPEVAALGIDRAERRWPPSHSRSSPTASSGRERRRTARTRPPAQRAKQHAPIAAQAAAANAVDVMSVVLEHPDDGQTARRRAQQVRAVQPADEPAVRVSASVIAMPETTNGAASTIVDIDIAAICAAGQSVTAENGMTRLPTCESASAAANSSDATRQHARHAPGAEQSRPPRKRSPRPTPCRASPSTPRRTRGGTRSRPTAIACRAPRASAWRGRRRRARLSARIHE